MVSTRLLGLVSTVLLVVGALAIGQALHLTVVSGEASLFSPAMLAYLVVGTALVLLGYRARQPIGEEYGLGSDETRETPAADHADADARGAVEEHGEAFDPSVSPLGESAPGDALRERAAGGDDGEGREEADPDADDGAPDRHDERGRTRDPEDGPARGDESDRNRDGARRDPDA